MGNRTYYDMAGYWPTSTELLAAPKGKPRSSGFRQAAEILGALKGTAFQALRK